MAFKETGLSWRGLGSLLSVQCVLPCRLAAPSARAVPRLARRTPQPATPSTAHANKGPRPQATKHGPGACTCVANDPLEREVPPDHGRRRERSQADVCGLGVAVRVVLGGEGAVATGVECLRRAQQRQQRQQRRPRVTATDSRMCTHTPSHTHRESTGKAPGKHRESTGKAP